MKPAKRTKSLKTKGLIILITGLFISIGLYAVGFFKSDRQDSGSRWRTATVTRRDMESSVLATGIIKPCVGAEVKVGSRISGIVDKLHVKIGDPVEKGQLLGELDRTEFLARVREAQAELENAEAERNYAALNLKRMKPLLRKGAISQDHLDEVQKTFDVTDSLVAQANARLENARIQLGYTWIRAPIGGVVASVSTQEGETVAASFTAPTFVVIIDLDRLEVWAYVDETDIGRIRVGQGASFTVDTYPGIDFDGKVTAIYPKAEMKDNVVNYIAIIDIHPKEDYILRPEMTTTVHIRQHARLGVLTVPKPSVKRSGGRKTVTVVAQGRTTSRPVETGWNNDGFIEITSGVTEGERVLIEKKEAIEKW